MTAVSTTVRAPPFVVIGDLSTMLVKVDLNEVDIDKVHLGQTVSITPTRSRAGTSRAA